MITATERVWFTLARLFCEARSDGLSPKASRTRSAYLARYELTAREIRRALPGIRGMHNATITVIARRALRGPFPLASEKS